MGKSTAAGFLLEHGAKVVDTDELARELVQVGQPALREIEEVFGKSVIASDGQLRRGELAKLVFADTDARKRLENILHPRIRQRWQAQSQEWRRQNVALTVVVIPLLFETEAQSHFDKIVCVACSESTRRERLRSRNWSEEQITKRIAAQIPIEEKIARSHFVVWTEGQLNNYSGQISRILTHLI